MSSRITRFLDAREEPVYRHLLPIDAYQHAPLVSLDEALKPVAQFFNAIEKKAWVAKENCKQPKEGLEQDESASIHLYTMQFSEGLSLFEVLNRTLRALDREGLKPWFKFLKIFMTALYKLPSYSGTVWRGVPATDLSSEYPSGKKFTWWGVSSCTTDMKVLEAAHFLGKTGNRTLFSIECKNGKSVALHSYFENKEEEIILMPGSYFEVKTLASLAEGLHYIHLKEIDPPFPMIEPPFNVNKASGTKSQLHPIISSSKNSWLNLRRHQNGMIKKPDELEMHLITPPKYVDKKILDRVHGSLIGLALGDAVGAHVEFQPQTYLAKNPVTGLKGGGTWGLKKGMFTDDTSMALCLASSLVVCQDFIPYDQLVRYKWWYRYGYMSCTGACFDIDAATKESLEEFERRQEAFGQKYNLSLEEIDFPDPPLLSQFNVECSEEGVAGNGALMRLAPVPLFFYCHPKYAVEFSGISGRITHGDDIACDACRYYGALIVAAVEGMSKEELLDNNFYSKHKPWFDNKKLHPDIMRIAEGSYKMKGGHKQGIRGKGYIVQSLEAALWAFWDNDTFEDGVLAAVNLGDDTDTTAAIYGQLAGAYYGYKELPPQWLEFAYAQNFIRCLCEWIVYEGEQWQPKQSLAFTTLSSTSQAQSKTSKQNPNDDTHTSSSESYSQQGSKTSAKNNQKSGSASQSTHQSPSESVQLKHSKSDTGSTENKNNAATYGSHPGSNVNRPSDWGPASNQSTSSTQPNSTQSQASVSPTPPNLLSDELKTKKHVGQWLISLGKEYIVYVNKFDENGVDGFWLLNHVNEDSLKNYGVEDKKHRQKMLKELEALRKTLSTGTSKKKN